MHCLNLNNCWHREDHKDANRRGHTWTERAVRPEDHSGSSAETLMDQTSLRIWKGDRDLSTYEAAKTLAGYEFQRVADVSLCDGSFRISFVLPVANSWVCSVYAFVINNEIVRIGSSKGLLRDRMRSWEKTVTASFNGQYKPTPKEESDLWRRELEQHGHGAVWAREGTRFPTPISSVPISGYQDEESELIARHMPRLNRGKHR